jgi:hypothetical protein
MLRSAIAPRTPMHPLLRQAKYRPLVRIVRTAASDTAVHSKVDLEKTAAALMGVVVAFAKALKEEGNEALLKAATERQHQRRAGRVRSLSAEESRRRFAALDHQLKSLNVK